MMSLSSRGKRGISVSKEESEESVEIKDLSVEQIEVSQIVEAVDDSMCVVHGGFLFLLDLDHETVQVFGVHESIVRVMIEPCLDIRRSLGSG
jgi:hypothetical protein